MDCDYSSGSTNPNQYIHLAVVGDGTTVILDDTTPLQVTNVTVGVDCNVTDAIGIRVSFQTSDNNGGGSCTVKKVRIYYDEGEAAEGLPEC